MDSRTKRALIKAITMLGLALVSAGTEITLHRLPYDHGLLNDGQCATIETPRQIVTECQDRP